MSTFFQCVNDWMVGSRRHLRIAAGALLLGASSCASLSPFAPVPASESAASVSVSDMLQESVAPVETTRGQNPAEPFASVSLADAQVPVAPPTFAPNEVFVADPATGPIRSISHEVTARNDVHLAQGGPFCPQPQVACPTCPPGNCGGALNCNTSFPDEYICDGGDKDIPVHYNDYLRQGLNFEDTVAEYVDHEGEFHVKPSTRVCVYAPRFASVRTIDVSHVDFTYDKLAGHHHDERLIGVNNELRPGVETQTDQPIGLDRRDSASGLIADVWEGNLTKIEWIGGNIQVNRLWQEIGFVRDGRFHQEDEARIAMSIQIAHDWSHDLYPIIMADTVQGGIVEASFRAADMTGIHDPRCPGDLRIVKLCEQESAQPGDVINFVIRYDNVGERELNGVRILDNLSPRLELVPGTVSFDRPGTLEVQDNNAGSQIIVFQLDEPLPGETGGVVSFQCLVR